jgi:transcriptional regulator with XRE-family HTH domain
MPESWWEYVQRASGHVTQKDIAEATGIEQSSISRWKVDQTRPKADAAVAFARGYGRPPVEALVAAGYLSEKEVSGVVEVAPSTSELSIDVLLAEIRRRVVRNERVVGSKTMPVDNRNVNGNV